MKHELPIDLLELYKHAAVNQISGFCDITNQLISNYDLVSAYHRVRSSAPNRHQRNKQYFVGHSGITSSGVYSNRREEHLAVALWNATQQASPMVMPSGEKLEFLDYQLPLKAAQGDKGVGKVDLFAVLGGSRPCVVELKIHATNKGRSDTPLRAFLEAFAYCAIVEANAKAIADEVLENFNVKLIENRPTLVLMAPEKYWSDYLGHKKAGNWWSALHNLADHLASRLGLASEFIALRNSGFEMGLNGQKPRLIEDCSLLPVADLVGSRKATAYQVLSTGKANKSMNTDRKYLDSLVHQFWDYAEAELYVDAGLIDCDQRGAQRPPVFKKDKETLNILTPPGADDELLTVIEATLPLKERHRWFRSMKSSQAVAQSVFGNLIAFGQLGLLEGLYSEEGLPAFCEELGTARAQLEHAVNYLGEPRPTSVDLWIDGRRRIAVECKLTETDFGTCSRPRLKMGKDSNYARDHCDGSYTRQRERQSRCSLTEIGVKYWDYIPSLFNWKSNDDCDPCPLGGTYQLVRNVLASCVTSDGLIDSANAHALIVFDARNPSFQAGGKANEQRRSARSALRNPGLLRSVSWQSLIEHLAGSGEFAWLVDKLKKKYGF